MSKLSDRLSGLLPRSAGDEEILLHVLLRKGLTEQERVNVLERLSHIAGSQEIEEVMRGTGIIVCPVPLKSVHAIAEMSEVDWIDLESEAPVGELCDEDR